MRALVTGGAGFIGSHLVDALLAAGYEVTVLDDLSSGRRENLIGAFQRSARLLEGSVTDPVAVERALPPGATVFHLAAQIDVRRAVSDPARDALVNVLGTLNVLEAARRHHARRFVLASTGGAIYGDADLVPTPESAPARPQSPYAASKASAERYVELYRDLHGLSTFTLRLANVYGPRQDPRGEAGVVCLYCDAAVAGTPATVYGDGSQTRDFVFVGDVVEAFVAAGRSRAVGCCNVGTGTEATVLELARTLGLAPTFAPARPGEVRRSCLDPSAARAILGWRARTTLAVGLAATSTAAATRRATAAFASP
jgi:UDP-glucose 4-epimerase